MSKVQIEKIFPRVRKISWPYRAWQTDDEDEEEGNQPHHDFRTRVVCRTRPATG